MSSKRFIKTHGQMGAKVSPRSERRVNDMESSKRPWKAKRKRLARLRALIKRTERRHQRATLTRLLGYEVANEIMDGDIGYGS